MTIGNYIAYLQDIRRYSPRTVSLYRDALAGFADWAGASGEADGGLIGQLIPSRIREYEGHLIDTGLKPRTVHLHMSALSGFCRYLVKEGQLASNPVKTVKRPKMEKRLPEYFTEGALEGYLEESEHAESADELSVLLSSDPQGKLARELYNRRLRRLIVSLLYGTGIRRAELIALQRQSVDEGRQTLRVRGKGDKMREIPLTPSLCEEISLYLQSVDSLKCADQSPEAPLLQTPRGARLYPVYVDRAVKAALGQVGSISGRKSPHVLRHTLATELLDGGADLNSIKELLGHSSLAATQVYTHNSIERLQKVYKSAHPRAKNDGNHGD